MRLLNERFCCFDMFGCPKQSLLVVDETRAVNKYPVNTTKTKTESITLLSIT